jgi:hypothetical protein
MKIKNILKLTTLSPALMIAGMAQVGLKKFPWGLSLLSVSLL